MINKKDVLNDKINNYLLAKSGIALKKVASDFVFLEAGEKIPTIISLEKKYNLSHGTVQNAITSLKNLKVIEIENKGKKGAFLKKKNEALLLKIMGIEHLVGCMPLPYSKRYEGLATGLTTSVESAYGIKSSLAFVRGANNRVDMLLANRYDYAIVSLFAAKKYIKEHEELTIIKEFGQQSYTGEHVMIFHDKDAKVIKKGMKVGVDTSSVDQMELTKKVCKGISVQLVNLSYSNVLKKVILGSVDCAIWNKDEIFDKHSNINYMKIDTDKEDTVAAMLVNKNNENVLAILERVIDEAEIIRIQKQVIDDLLIPTY